MNSAHRPAHEGRIRLAHLSARGCDSCCHQQRHIFRHAAAHRRSRARHIPCLYKRHEGRARTRVTQFHILRALRELAGLCGNGADNDR